MIRDLLYILIGILGTGGVLFLAKWFGGKKGDVVAGQDTAKAQEALDKASELLARRAAVEAKTEADRKRVEEKLLIEDPVEKLNAIADELKDL